MMFCDDCVSRQAVIQAIENLNIPEDMCTFEIKSHLDLAIGSLPSVQVKEKTGIWLNSYGIFKCSLCGYCFEHEGYKQYFNFCPCCGAKMGSGDELWLK